MFVLIVVVVVRFLYMIETALTVRSLTSLGLLVSVILWHLGNRLLVEVQETRSLLFTRSFGRIALFTTSLRLLLMLVLPNGARVHLHELLLTLADLTIISGRHLVFLAFSHCISLIDVTQAPCGIRDIIIIVVVVTINLSRRRLLNFTGK